MKKWEDIWFYYKKHILIALAVILASGYLYLQKAITPDADYHIGLLRPVPCTEAEADALEERFASAGTDLNGDGQVLVQIHTYFVDLADDSLNAGVDNAQTISSLDADLIGKLSGIFLVEDVETFQKITDNILEPIIPDFDMGLSLGLRRDADSAYVTLFENLF